MSRLLVLALFMIPTMIRAQQLIPIQNPSFEAAVTFNGSAQCGNGTWGTIPGWEVQQAPGAGFGVIDWTCGPVPDGKAVAFFNGYGMFQDLGVLPQAGVYSLTFWVANWFYYYPTNYTVSLTIGGQPVCSVMGYGLGDFTQIPLVCPITGYIAVDHGFGFNGNLGILVQDSDWSLLIDNFSPIMFTPQN